MSKSDRSTGVVSHLTYSFFDRPRPTAGRSSVRFVRPRLEILEARNLFAVSISLPFPNVNTNISQQNDNQAEPTIAVDPTNPAAIFTASVTTYGTVPGTFDPNMQIPVNFPVAPNAPSPTIAQLTHYTPGLFAVTTNFAATSNVILTGGPTLRWHNAAIPAGCLGRPAGDLRQFWHPLSDLHVNHSAGRIGNGRKQPGRRGRKPGHPDRHESAMANEHVGGPISCD
jgi:hypothetical protein